MLWPVICQGRTISQDALEWLRGWIGAHRDWSRKRLARELCVLWDWRNGMGRLKDFAARSFLLKLAERELIELPPVREYKRSGPQTVGWVKADFEHTPEPLCADLEQVRPVQLDWVEAGSDLGKQFNSLATSMLESKQGSAGGDGKKKFIEFFSVVPGKTPAVRDQKKSVG